MYINNLAKASLLIVLVSTLSARSNPFVPTQTYLEEKEALINPIIEDRMIDIVLEEEPKEEIKKLEEIIIKEPEESNITKTTVIHERIKIYKYNLLDFVNIDITNDTMNIGTEFELKKQFILEEENKIVFDFVGKKRFYTKRETLSSHKDFKKIVIGAHPENKYFRVVIQTQENVKDYEININEEGLVTIYKIAKDESD